MDDLENEIMNFDQMGTSIDKIKNPGMENKDIFGNKNVKEGTCSGVINVGGKNINPNKDFDMTDFVQDLEDNLDNFDNIDINGGPKPSNIDGDFKKKKETFVDDLVTYSNEAEVPQKEEIKVSFNDIIYNFLIKIKEPLIIVLLFILLNNTEIIGLTYQLPFMNLTNNQYPSLIIRGILLAIIIYYLRKMELSKNKKVSE
jgi:hypothetical protein